MRKLLLAALILLFVIDAADARKRRHHFRLPSYMVEVPSNGPEAYARGFERDPRTMTASPRFARRSPLTLAALVPPDWQLQPPDPNWNGKRFVSPDGASWFAAYRTAATDALAAEHMKRVIFAEDETITSMQGERTRVAVSGFKGSRLFYRKAILACAGKTWHHVAFEYPVELRRHMDQFVALAAEALENTQTECEETASTARQR
jgi:hypothetical protein